MRNLLLAFLILSACQQKTSPSLPPVPDDIDPSMEAEALTYKGNQKGAAVNAESNDEFKRILKKWHTRVPSYKVVFKQHSSTYMDPEGKSFLQEIRSNCKINGPTEKKAGKIAVGSPFGSVTTSNLEGKDCPVAYTSFEKTTMLMTQVDEQKESVEGHGILEMRKRFEIKDNSVAQMEILSGYDINVDGTIRVLDFKEDYRGVRKGKMYATAQLSGAYLLLNGRRAPLTGKVEVLETRAFKKAQVIVKTAFSGRPFVIYMKDIDKKQSFLVNGVALTKTQLMEEYGLELEAFE